MQYERNKSSFLFSHQLDCKPGGNLHCAECSPLTGHCSESVCARNFLKCPEITPDDKTQQQKTKFLKKTLGLLFKKTNVISFG